MTPSIETPDPYLRTSLLAFLVAPYPISAFLATQSPYYKFNKLFFYVKCED